MTKKEIRPEIAVQLVNKEEVDLLVTLARDTFVTAFGHCNKTTDMNQYLNKHMNATYTLKEMQTKGTFFYFARLATVSVGYLKLNIDQAQNEPMGSNSLEIERIYIEAAYQGRGIGQQLMDFALMKAKEWQKATVWLGVWDRNPRAIKIYERNGFEHFGSHDFQLGNDLQTDLLMKKELDHAW